MTASDLLEWIGFLSGVLCVWWVVKERIANWPMGIVNCLAWLILLWINAIYLNALLQLVYIVISVYGWWHWLWGGEARDSLPVRCATSAERLRADAVIGVGAVAGARLMVLAGDAAPIWDALTTMTSIVAIYWQARKIYESWILSAERRHHLLRALRLPGPVAHGADAGGVRRDVHGRPA
jgi:nicotinamide mononucleotide transporter